MISRWRWLLLQFTHRLWVRATIFAMIGVATALVGIGAERFLPADMPNLVGADSVGSVLNILASSMLSVTTFSLAVMVSAYGAATTNVTPRATRLLISDTNSQNALSTFLGTFLFSLVGIVTLSVAGYGQRGRLVLFVATIGVIVVIVVTMLRWMEYLTRLGRVSETTARVEEAACRALKARRARPCLGGRRRDGSDLPQAGTPLRSTQTGYVQHIDVGALQAFAEKVEGDVVLEVLPGSFVHMGMTLAVTTKSGDEASMASALNALTIGEERTFEQDPRFGILVLSEIASRALSSAVNDSGTAIDVVGRLVRILLVWAEPHETEEVECDRVWVRALSEVDLVGDAFAAIARDGASRIEVMTRLLKGLKILEECGDPGLEAASRKMTARVAGLAAKALDADDLESLGVASRQRT